MIPLPRPTEDPNILALARWGRETQTGIAGTVVTLEGHPIEGFEQFFKNGALLPGTAYTISGKTVTLGVALIAADVFVAYYYTTGY